MKRDLGKLFKKGEIIFRQGEPAACMYVVQKGEVELVVESDFGIKLLATLQKGDVFGEVSLFAEKVRFATARATQDTWVMTLDEKSFVNRLHQDPSLAFHMIRQMAHRIYDQDQLVMRGFIDEAGRSHDVTGFVSYIDLVALVEKELTRAKRLWQPLSFAIIDIDHFDTLQAQFGSVIGEDLLTCLCQTIKGVLRRQDVVGRFGEDQFGLLLYEADGEAAIQVLEKVRRSFQNLWGRVEHPDIVATFSCGIASYPDYESSARLHKAAHKALSTSKQAGNQIILAAAPAKK
ncbi:MAG: GGDEF domain-containing protein [Magnetococcales bacterium]|nr:GGDEF domain-containing protein [Magnetococcales bacterium]